MSHTSTSSTIVMDGLIGYVCFFEYHRVEKIVGENLTAVDVLRDVLGPNSQDLSMELTNLEEGETRIHLADDEDKENILRGIETETEGLLLQIDEVIEKGEERAKRMRTRQQVELDRALLVALIKNRNKIWTLRYKHEDGNYYGWDEVGFYIQIR